MNNFEQEQHNQPSVLTSRLLSFFSFEDLQEVANELTELTQKNFRHDLSGIEVDKLLLDLRAIKQFEKLMIHWKNKYASNDHNEFTVKEED